MEIERQQIIVQRNSKIICVREDGKTILAVLERDIRCWPEGRDTIEVRQLEVVPDRS